MLSAEKNERLTRVGPGTPMGELLRRYRWPIATHDMATRVPVKRRLLGEDFVLYRDGSGTVGLLAEQCPHRRAPLWLSCTEDVGLRCALRRPGAGVELVRFCPACGAAPAFVQEYWVAADRHVVCWCVVRADVHGRGRRVGRDGASGDGRRRSRRGGKAEH
jgi:Rieske [2Fe-2S] domain